MKCKAYIIDQCTAEWFAVKFERYKSVSLHQEGFENSVHKRLTTAGNEEQEVKIFRRNILL